MKRIIKFLVGILVFLLIAIIFVIGKPGNGNAFVPELHGKAVDIYFNDNLITDWGDALPFIDNTSGRTLIPLRFYAENIGCKVEWFQKDRKIIISYSEKDYYGNLVYSKPLVITLYVNNRKTTVYDPKTDTTKIVWLDQAPWQEPKYPWRVYVPLRFISTCLGDIVNWYPSGSQALLPNVVANKDTVLLAHLEPEISSDDYQIIPEKRIGKYALSWTIEQFIKEEGKIKETYFFEKAKVYSIKFASGLIIIWQPNIGIINITSSDNYLKNVWILSPNGNKYMYYIGDKKFYPLEQIEADFTWPLKYFWTFTEVRGASEVKVRDYAFENGIEIYVVEDWFLPPSFRGYWIEWIMFYRPGWSTYRVCTGQEMP